MGGASARDSRGAVDAERYICGNQDGQLSRRKTNTPKVFENQLMAMCRVHSIPARFLASVARTIADQRLLPLSVAHRPAFRQLQSHA